jgi:hypothetical protein
VGADESILTGYNPMSMSPEICPYAKKIVELLMNLLKMHFK